MSTENQELRNTVKITIESTPHEGQSDVNTITCEDAIVITSNIKTVDMSKHGGETEQQVREVAVGRIGFRNMDSCFSRLAEGVVRIFQHAAGNNKDAFHANLISFMQFVARIGGISNELKIEPEGELREVYEKLKQQAAENEARAQMDRPAEPKNKPNLHVVK